jgi:hypothetical protein
MILDKIEFELLPNSPQVKGHTRLWSVTALPGLALILLAFAVGWLSKSDAFFIGVMLVLLIAGYLWGFRAMGLGVVEISADRLIVRSRSGRRRQTHTWTDIAEVRLNTLRRIGTFQRIWATITRVDADLPFVELRLRRRARFNPLSGEIGSVKFGTPGFLRSITFYVRDPEGLVRVANSYLRFAPPR